MTQAPWYNSLRVQIVLLLTLALLPLGAVAIYQTSRVERAAEKNSQMALLALTGKTAQDEELIIARAISTARFVAIEAQDFLENPVRCRGTLGRLVERNENISFIGLMPKSGVMNCMSSGAASFEVADQNAFAAQLARQSRSITLIENAPLSKTSVINLAEPFTINQEFSGFVLVSVPNANFPTISDEMKSLGLRDLITFNPDGTILTARQGLDDVESRLPAELDLSQNTVLQPTARYDVSASGEEFAYHFVPIKNSPVTAMGIWEPTNGAQISLQPALFPLLMWFASMAVAVLSIYTLVLRHLRSMRVDMDRFTQTRMLSDPKKKVRMPNEIQALADNFENMTGQILREEAELEDTVRDKNVLIKEVHHRVKNNLQLIASIMNMQIRKAKHEETKNALSRLQDRVLSLATIHRDLYQSQNAGLVNVGSLVSDVVDRSLEIGHAADLNLDVTRDIQTVLLYPDQAVPLSLMVAEAMTNAIKYLGTPDGQAPWLRVSLRQVDTECELKIENSVGDKTSEPLEGGLGTQLMNAFAIQLGAKSNTDHTPDGYEFRLQFTISDFKSELRDF